MITDQEIREWTEILDSNFIGNGEAIKPFAKSLLIEVKDLRRQLVRAYKDLDEANRRLLVAAKKLDEANRRLLVVAKKPDMAS